MEGLEAASRSILFVVIEPLSPPCQAKMLVEISSMSTCAWDDAEHVRKCVDIMEQMRVIILLSFRPPSKSPSCLSPSHFSYSQHRGSRLRVAIVPRSTQDMTPLMWADADDSILMTQFCFYYAVIDGLLSWRV